MTPTQLSAYRVRKILEGFPDSTPDLRERYYAELSAFDQVQSMNSELLAAALMLLFRVHDTVTPEIFANNDLIIGVLTRILPSSFSLSTQNGVDLLTRYKADLLRYIRAILTSRVRQGQYIGLAYEDIEEYGDQEGFIDDQGFIDENGFAEEPLAGGNISENIN